MANMAGLVQQLKKERDRAERELLGLNAALQAFVGVYSGKAEPKPIRQRGKMSISARKKIAAAQKARWAQRATNATVETTQPKRKVSASARRKIAAAQRARWAKWRSQQKKVG
jgi:hypothetical protein